MTRATNHRSELGVSGGGATWRSARLAEMDAMEALPVAVQRMVAENATNLSAHSVEAYHASVLRQVGDPETAERAVCRKLRELEGNEIQLFAGRHLAQFGYRLPHVAAGASVVRYDSLRPGARRHPGITGFGLRAGKRDAVRRRRYGAR